MLRTALHNIDSSRLYAGVSQKVRQLCHILLQAVKRPGKQMPEVVGKHLSLPHPRLGAEGPHLPPDVGTVHRPPGPGDKDRPRRSLLPPAVIP